MTQSRQQLDLEAIAAVAATGCAPTQRLLTEMEGIPDPTRWRVGWDAPARRLVRIAGAMSPPSIWRVRVHRLRMAGLVEMAPLGTERAIWPANLPAVRALIGAEAVDAWIACRDVLPPTDGWVQVEDEMLRVVDGIALAREMGADDWWLRRGGVAYGHQSGRMTRWEVVNAER